MSKILPHTRAKLTELILLDLQAGQSAADSIDGRLKVSKDLTENICRALVADGHLGIRYVSISTRPDLAVYHLANHRP